MFLRFSRLSRIPSVSNFSRFSRLFSTFNQNSSFKYNIEEIKSHNPTPVEISQLVRQYFQLYNYAKAANKTVHWSSEPKVIKSLNSLMPHIENVEPNVVNTLITNLSYLTVHKHPIWTRLERLFVDKTYKSMDCYDTPHFITAFSMNETKNKKLWNFLDEKMIEFCSKYQLNTVQAGLTLRSLLKVNAGSKQLRNILKNHLIINIEELKPPLITSLVTSLVGFDEEEGFVHIIVARFLLQLDKASIEDLNKMLSNMFIIKLDYNLIRRAEQHLAKNMKLLSLKHISNCVGCYNSVSQVKKEDYSDFPLFSIKYFIENRHRLIEETPDKHKATAYECKIIGTALINGYEIDKNIIVETYKRILMNEKALSSHPNLLRFYSVIKSNADEIKKKPS